MGSVLDGTLETMGTAWRAAEGPELDEGLVVPTGVLAIQQFARQLPVDALPSACVYRVAEGEEAAEDAVHIAIHRREGQVVGKGEDSPTCVGPDPWQTAELLERAWQLASEVRDDDLGGAPEVASAGVIA